MYWHRLPLLAACVSAPALAQRVGAPTDDLTNVGIDELFNVQVTSVGRKAQRISKAPASVFVLTAEDIRRSGATSIPEALRWVPGVTVLSLDDRSWTVSIRGSARMYSDKILVMIDGRSLYTPVVFGRHLGRDRCPHGRHRTDRGGPGSRGCDVGTQRRERRDQRDHQEGAAGKGRPGQRRRRQRSPRSGIPMGRGAQ